MIKKVTLAEAIQMEGKCTIMHSELNMKSYKPIMQILYDIARRFDFEDMQKILSHGDIYMETSDMGMQVKCINANSRAGLVQGKCYALLGIDDIHKSFQIKDESWSINWHDQDRFIIVEE